MVASPRRLLSGCFCCIDRSTPAGGTPSRRNFLAGSAAALGLGTAIAANKPAAAVDSCFDTTGSLIESGQDVWAGILDHRPAGACTAQFPTYTTSRMVSGGPMTADVFACHLQPVEEAIAHGLYAPWLPSADDAARLHAIFPQGVCDYTKGDLGLPPELHANGK